MPIQYFSAGGRKCAALIPKNTENSEPSLLCLMGGSDADELFSSFEKRLLPHIKKGFAAPVIVSALDVDWNLDYSPWEAELFGGRHFGGQADHFLDFLEKSLIPEAEANFGLHDPERYIMGYSLGGLAALYFFLKSDLFTGCGALSASLWYPDFMEYMKKSEKNSGRLYLSLGKGELKTRNALMKQCGALYEETQKFFDGKLEESFFEWNNGGHGFEVPERHLRAILHLLQK